MNFEGKGKVGQAEKSWPSEINGKGQDVYLKQFVIYCFIEKIKSPPTATAPAASCKHWDPLALNIWDGKSTPVGYAPGLGSGCLVSV